MSQENLSSSVPRNGSAFPPGHPVEVFYPTGEIVRYPSVVKASDSLGCSTSTAVRLTKSLRPFHGHYIRKVGDPRPFQPPMKKTPIVDDDGIVYPNASVASLLTGIPASTIYKRLQSGRYRYKSFLPQPEQP